MLGRKKNMLGFPWRVFGVCVWSDQNVKNPKIYSVYRVKHRETWTWECGEVIKTFALNNDKSNKSVCWSGNNHFSSNITNSETFKKKLHYSIATFTCKKDALLSKYITHYTHYNCRYCNSLLQLYKTLLMKQHMDKSNQTQP